MSPFLLTLAINYLSWALLSLGLPRGYQQHYGVTPRPMHARLLRLSGWPMALLGLALSVWAFDWGMGSVIWASTWMLAAMSWVLLQAWRPQLSRWLAPVLLLLAVVDNLFG